MGIYEKQKSLEHPLPRSSSELNLSAMAALVVGTTADSSTSGRTNDQNLGSNPVALQAIFSHNLLSGNRENAAQVL